MTEREELLIATSFATLGKLAETVTLVVGIAAERHPEEIRKALSAVFDLSAVEESTKRVMLVLSRVQADAKDVKDLLGVIQEELASLSKRLDQLEYTASMLEQKKPNGVLPKLTPMAAAKSK
jgi:hypothetical protein